MLLNARITIAKLILEVPESHLGSWVTLLEKAISYPAK